MIKIINRGKTGIALVFMAGLAAMALGMPTDAFAGTLKATPRISLQYNYYYNVYANDLDQLDDAGVDPATATFMDYLVGLSLIYTERPHEFSISGDIGYEQYLTIGGYLEDLPDDDPSQYDSFTGTVRAAYKYRRSSTLIFELWDQLMVSRDLQSVFGEGTDAIGYWSLYTNNVIGVDVKMKPATKIDMLIRYNYDTLVFEEPENDLDKPSDSTEHRGTVRLEYKFRPKTVGILDFQYANRVFEDVNNIEIADYELYQLMGGLRYHFRPDTYIEGLGGAAIRRFTDLPDAYDLEDTTSPVAMVIFQTGKPRQYRLTLVGTYGLSTYGQNLFFNFGMGMVDFAYFFTPKVSFNTNVNYRYNVYDIEDNDREWLWDDKDRIDENTRLHADLHWDILQKGGQGTLTFEVGGNWHWRNSNIEGVDDYNPVLVASMPGVIWPSYNTETALYYAQIQMLPSILFGD